MRFEYNYSKFIDNFQKRDSNFYDKDFWDKVKSLNTDSYFIITFSTENLTYRYGYKPYIIKISSFDYVPYNPSTAEETFDILKKIYGVNIYKDKKFLTKEFIKLQFKKKIGMNGQK